MRLRVRCATAGRYLGLTLSVPGAAEAPHCYAACTMTVEHRESLVFGASFIVGAVTASLAFGTLFLWFGALAHLSLYGGVSSELQGALDLGLVAVFALVVTVPLTTGVASYALAAAVLRVPLSPRVRRWSTSRIGACLLALHLTLASAGLPERIDTLADYDAVGFGLPLTHFVQRQRGSPPDGVPPPWWAWPGSPWEEPVRVEWVPLVVDVAAMLAVAWMLRAVIVRRTMLTEGAA